MNTMKTDLQDMLLYGKSTQAQSQDPGDLPPSPPLSQWLLGTGPDPRTWYTKLT